jgi:hypothetical protein
MKKRVLAWVLLIGFLLLLLNLIVFKYQWQISIMAYLMIMVIFLFTNKKRSNYDDGKENDIDKNVDDVTDD